MKIETIKKNADKLEAQISNYFQTRMGDIARKHKLTVVSGMGTWTARIWLKSDTIGSPAYEVEIAEYMLEYKIGIRRDQSNHWISVSEDRARDIIINQCIDDDDAPDLAEGEEDRFMAAWRDVYKLQIDVMEFELKYQNLANYIMSNVGDHSYSEEL